MIVPQVGIVPLIVGQQSYDITFTTPFGVAPSFFSTSLAMPSSSGEIFDLSFDASTLTANGVTVWLNGLPTAASVGGYINWLASGEAPAIPTSTSGTGITVPQLFHRIGRRARGGDFTALSMSEQTDLADAANAALMRLYNVLPNYFREQTQGFVLPSPLTLAAVGVTQYGKFVTGVTFTEDQFGMTINLEQDQGWNQIIGENELLNPYMGTTGTVQGTVYGNAIHSTTYPLDRIVGNPMPANQSQTPLFGPNLLNSNAQGNASWLFAQTVGVPQAWWPQVFGNSQGKKPIMVIRFAPAPQSAMAMNVKIGFWPKRLTLADYDNGTLLVVPDQFIESCLIPMAIQEFMTSPAYVIRGDEQMIADKGARGEAFAKLQFGQIGAPNNRCFTPNGY